MRDDRERHRRKLRTRIGRLRRRIDRRVRSAEHEGRRLLSWRTYVSRYPAGAVATAFGVGLAFSTGLAGRRLLRMLGARMIRRGLSHLGTEAWREVGRIWADSTPDRTKAEKNPPPGGGADDG